MDDPRFRSTNRNERMLAMRSSIEQRLHEISARENLALGDRLAWLAEHIDEYLGRLWAVVQHMGTWPELSDHDLFAVIEAAAGVVRDELKADPDSSSSLAESWRAVEMALLELRECVERDSIRKLWQSVALFRIAAITASQ